MTLWHLIPRFPKFGFRCVLLRHHFLILLSCRPCTQNSRGLSAAAAYFSYCSHYFLLNSNIAQSKCHELHYLFALYSPFIWIHLS